MAKPRHEFDAIGSDSFLDVVTNIVGILIVLVMVVGIRIKNSPAKTEAAPPAPPAESIDPAEVSELQSQAAAVERESAALDKRSLELEVQAAVARDDRNALAMLAAEAEHELARRHGDLDEREQRRFDVERKLDDARRALERTQAEKEQAPVIEVASYHTPLGRTVKGPEVHFQLRDNRVAFVAKDDLERALAQAVRQRGASVFKDRRLATLAVGPIADFSMRAQVRRVDKGVIPENGATVSDLSLVEYVLIPTADDIGEPLDGALQPSSQFWSRVFREDARKTTVTFWTYANGYAAFRKLKKELYERGYAVACRMLPEGHPIGASPQGSKSIRQ